MKIQSEFVPRIAKSIIGSLEVRNVLGAICRKNLRPMLMVAFHKSIFYNHIRSMISPGNQP